MAGRSLSFSPVYGEYQSWFLLTSPYINKAIKDNSIVIPAICMWEISMLAASERISLSENTLDRIRNVTSAPGVSIHPLSPEVAYESTILPGDFHGDPADSMIVATARVLNAALLIFDKQICTYGEKGFVEIKKHATK